MRPPGVWEELDALVERSGARRIAILITIHYHVRATADVYARYGGRPRGERPRAPERAARLGPDVP